jgi:flagellar assembly protein FliH
MEAINDSKKSGLISPFSFPDLTSAKGMAKAGTAVPGFAFQRQFTGVSGGGDRRAAEERFQPSWRNVAEAPSVDVNDNAEIPEPYRQMIERLIEEHRTQTQNVYQAGLAEGRKAGLLQGQEQGKKEGYDLGKADGYQQGYDKGKQDGEALVLPVVASFRQAIGACEDVKRQLHFEAQREALKLAMVIARKILVREVRTDPEAIVGVIRNALAMAESSVVIRLRVHPDVFEYCLDKRQILAIPDEAVITADPAISAGGCIVETEVGEIDASIETQLQVLAEALDREIEMASNAAGQLSPDAGDQRHEP